MHCTGAVVVMVVLTLTTLPPQRAAAQAPPQKLSAAEQQAVRALEPRLATKLNSKDNPGDSKTWYVLLFQDSAMTKTKTVGGSSAPGVISWSEGSSKQEKSAQGAIVVQGRRNAAQAIVRYLTSPNAAAMQLQSPKTGNGVGHPGWMTKTTLEAAGASKNWDFRAFPSETDAKAFLDSLKLPKK